MTQQYIAGEFSSLLADLGRAEGGLLRNRVDQLRHRVEFSSRRLLPTLAHEALDLADTACWASLEHGDITRFHRCASATVALADFTHEAGLLV